MRKKPWMEPGTKRNQSSSGFDRMSGIEGLYTVSFEYTGVEECKQTVDYKVYWKVVWYEQIVNKYPGMSRDMIAAVVFKYKSVMCRWNYPLKQGWDFQRSRKRKKNLLLWQLCLYLFLAVTPSDLNPVPTMAGETMLNYLLNQSLWSNFMLQLEQVVNMQRHVKECVKEWFVLCQKYHFKELSLWQLMYHSVCKVVAAVFRTEMRWWCIWSCRISIILCKTTPHAYKTPPCSFSVIRKIT